MIRRFPPHKSTNQVWWSSSPRSLALLLLTHLSSETLPSPLLPLLSFAPPSTPLAAPTSSILALHSRFTRPRSLPLLYTVPFHFLTHASSATHFARDSLLTPAPRLRALLPRALNTRRLVSSVPPRRIRGQSLGRAEFRARTSSARVPCRSPLDYVL